MEQEGFKVIFDAYDSDGFNNDELNAVMAKWKVYRDKITGEDGLPIECWLSVTEDTNGNPVSNDTIVKFICSQRKTTISDDLSHRGFSLFGSAMMHDQKNIVLKSKKDDGGKVEYYNGFESDKIDKASVADSYKKMIVPLLKKAIACKTKDDVFKFFGSKEYKPFKGCKFFEGLFILESLRDECSYKNAFAWITAPDRIETLEELFNLQGNGKCFMERNYDVYQTALKWAGFDSSNIPDKNALLKLNRLIYNLTSQDNLFTDFLNPNLIFSGAPATGKTYTVETRIKELQSIDIDAFPNDPSPKFTQFHPSYTYQDFIEGIKPSGLDSNGNLKLEVMNGSFKQFCIDVRKKNEEMWNEITESGKSKPDKDNPNTLDNWPHYYYVVDEINRGNLSNIFGETFTLLEYRDYDFSSEYNESNNSLVETALSNVISNIKNDDLIYKRINDKSVVFGIPFNIHFIGMMNDVDRSIDAFDLAFRRRFKWNPTYCDYDVIENECKLKENEAKNYVDSCKLLNYLITGDERDKPSKDVKSSDSQKLGITFQIGHGYFLKIRTINPTKSLNKRKEILFDNYLLGTLKEYLIQNIGEGKATEDFLEKMKKSFCN